MREIIKKEKIYRFIYYCFQNNKINKIKLYFRNEAIDYKWSFEKASKLLIACIHYNCLDLLDSIKVNMISQHPQHIRANMIYYNKEIKKICNGNINMFNNAKKKYISVFKKLHNVFDIVE